MRCWPGSLPGCDRVHKVTIIPRGRALGVTQLLPEEDRLQHLASTICSRGWRCCWPAGRPRSCMFDEFSAGAENDLQEATRLARRMVTHWGMSERLGPVAYHAQRGPSVPRPRNPQHDASSASTRPRSSTRKSPRFCTPPRTAQNGRSNSIPTNSTRWRSTAGARDARRNRLRDLFGPSIYESTGRVAPAGPARVASVRE